jgi:uncharacterized membrane protein
MSIINKKEKQVERLIFFSDGVFAIAITLLAIELKVPEIENYSEQELAGSLIKIIPHFISFLMSFMVIGIYWISHHRMFFFVANYNYRLLWLNLFFLFYVVLMPFSSNVYGMYSNLNTAFYLYVGNITMIALLNYTMWNYISKLKNKLSHGLDNPRLSLYYKLRALSVPICFGIGILVSLLPYSAWTVTLSRCSPILIFPFMSFLRRRFANVLIQQQV